MSYRRGFQILGGQERDLPIVCVHRPWWETTAVIIGMLASLAVLLGGGRRR